MEFEFEHFLMGLIFFLNPSKQLTVYGENKSSPLNRSASLRLLKGSFITSSLNINIVIGLSATVFRSYKPRNLCFLINQQLE